MIFIHAEWNEISLLQWMMKKFRFGRNENETKKCTDCGE